MKRKEAKAQGLDKYNTGKPCRNGHLSDRYTLNGTCVECCKITSQKHEYERVGYDKKYYESHKEEISKKNKEKYRLKKSIFSSI
jgi:hypothetical protein